jgi:uncharacterized DUF497 family protein
MVSSVLKSVAALRKAARHNYSSMGKVAVSSAVANMHIIMHNRNMKIVWDESKRRTNLRKHGFDFADAAQAFSGITCTFEDKRFDYSEQRFTTLGMLKDIIVVMVHTETARELRIISMRKATRHEQTLYFQNL